MAATWCHVAGLVLLPLASGSEVSFDEYRTAFEKTYTADEVEARRDLFDFRVRQVEALNARPGALWVAGINRFTDMHPHEMRSFFGYAKGAGRADGGIQLQAAYAPELPASVDWREHQPAVVSPVKNQGYCGSCWAFSAAESMESHIAIATGVLLSLSPQQLTSCVPNPRHCGGGGGCAGATAQLAFNYSVTAGIYPIWDYPYFSGISGKTGKCRENVRRYPTAGITGYAELPKNDASALMQAVAFKGPVSISVDASNWWMYSSGIFDHCNKTNPDINHAVQLVGYGEASSTKYWLVRNSWGTDYGEAGYIRIRRYDVEACGEDITPWHGSACEGERSPVEACGECGILYDSAYPTGGWRGHAMHRDNVESSRGNVNSSNVDSSSDNVNSSSGNVNSSIVDSSSDNVNSSSDNVSSSSGGSDDRRLEEDQAENAAVVPTDVHV